MKAIQITFILCLASIALPIMAMAASLDDAIALYDKKQYQLALPTIQEEANKGNAKAQWYFGLMLFDGKGVKQNLKESVNWILKSANQNYPNAQYGMGYLYDKGKGVGKNPRKAFEWYNKASTQGHIIATLQVGVAYHFGKGTPKNMTQAIDFYEKAAQNGNKQAQHNLGNIYQYGTGGVPLDMPKAFSFYRSASVAGFAPSQEKLGYMYYFGEGVKKDTAEGITWYVKAAEQNDAQAQYSLGTLYYEDKNLQDLAKAEKWLNLSAKNGFAKAQLKLAGFYENRASNDQDIARAAQWSLKAAKQNYIPAQRNIARMYKYGLGVKTNCQQAVQWYNEAVKRGDSRSAIELGNMYEWGKCVPQDYSTAKTWYQKAIDLGAKGASYYLNNLPKDFQATDNEFALFGIAIARVSRDVMRTLLQEQEIPQIRIDDRYHADVYDSSSILEFTDRLEIYYTADGTKLAKAIYRIPNSNGQILQSFKNMLNKKYGTPSVNTHLYDDGGFNQWNVKNDVRITIKQIPPSKTGYLTFYVNQNSYQLDQEIEANKKKQPNAF